MSFPRRQGRTRIGRWRRGLLVTLVGVVVPGGVASGGSAEGGQPDAVDKVRDTMQAAVAQAPQIALQLSQLGAEVATVRAESGAGTPTLTWQSEGIGGGFDRNANAADYLRFSLPFNRPWGLGTIHDLKVASAQLLETGSRATALEVAGLAGRRWLDLAAATAMAHLAQARLDRLSRALEIQQLRYELGEISGSERTQIELQRAREAAALESSEALRFALQRELEALAPGGFPPPAAQDLVELAESTASPVDSQFQEQLLASPFLQFVGTGVEVARLEAQHQRGAAWGSPEIEVEWERIPDLGGIESFNSFGFRFAFPLPIGKQGRQRILASEHTAQAAAAERVFLQQQLTVRVQSAMGAARGAEAALAALEPSIAQVSFTERSLSEQFRLGAISYLVYLDGFSRLDEVIQGAIEARHALLVARLELAQVLGTDIYFPLPDLESESGS